MIYGIGRSEADKQKGEVGIASKGWEGNNCNMNLNQLSQWIKEGMQPNDLVGLIFHTIGVSDGISMGTPGMRFSLPSRDVIADSIETVVSAQWYDGVVAVTGCDQNKPGPMIVLCILNRPSLPFFGGTIIPGCRWGINTVYNSLCAVLGPNNLG